jgi:hypothetical protein
LVGAVGFYAENKKANDVLSFLQREGVNPLLGIRGKIKQ